VDVKRDAGRVWIDGVPDGKFGIYWDQYVNAMELLLRFRGVNTDRDEVMAYSGDAFNLCHASNWQGIAYLCMPTNPVENLARAYGFEYGQTHQGATGPFCHKNTPEERREITRTALQRIYAEIDAGRPVLLAGPESHCGSVTLVVGYEPEKPTLCHIGDDEPYRWTLLRGVAPGAVNQGDFNCMDGRCRGTVTQNFVGGWQANPACLIGSKVSAPSPQDRLVAALRLAVDLHRSASHHRGNWGGVDYYFGAEAYMKWAQALSDLDYPADTTKPLPMHAYDWYDMGNMDTQVDQIVQGRTAAAAFCERAARTFAQAAEPLQSAAESYRQQVEIAREVFAPFIPAFNGADERRAAWLSDEASREAGAEAVRQMLAKERAAIAKLEEALARIQAGKAF
jgi:hypothetical protein